MDQANALWLSAIERPACIVENGIVTNINDAARRSKIKVGLPIALYLHTGQEEYRAFTDGSLKLTMQFDNMLADATAVKFPGFELITLEQEDKETQLLRVLALAALELRAPLTGIMSATNELDSQNERLNRNLLSLQRLIGNMSDGLRYRKTTGCLMTDVDINAFLGELMEKASVLLSKAGYRLTYTGLNTPVRHSISVERIERAVYNLLSNAVKVSPKGSEIRASLTKFDQMLMITVTDCGNGLPIEAENEIFSRYMREPEIEGGNDGMGLGMFIVRAAARAHGGTVLFRKSANGGMEVTITISLQHKPTSLSSPVLTVDYSGEQDHALLELSDVLPASLYKK